MESDLPSDRPAGWFLVGAAVLTTLALTHHPSVSSHEPEAVVRDLAAGGRTDGIFHASIIVMIAVLYLGLVGFARRRGLQSLLTVAGLVAATAGLAGLTGAALIDGFFFPGFGAYLAHGNPALIEPGSQIISAAALTLQILAKFGVFALAVAIVLWSIGLFDRSRAHVALAIVGFVAAAALVIVTATVATRLSPHNVALVFGLQALWYAFAGVLMIQRRL